MKKRDEDTVACPNCGEQIKRNAAACPHCGSDERTGWSDATYLDGIGLPDDVDYDSIVDAEFGENKGTHPKVPTLYVIVAAIILALFVIGILRGALG